MVGLIDLEVSASRSNDTIATERAVPPHGNLNLDFTATTTINPSEMDNEMELCNNDYATENSNSSPQQDTNDTTVRMKKLQQNKQSSQTDKLEDSNDQHEMENMNQDLVMDEMDEEQLKRILACKRLSEGCNRFNGANYICRKNSLHMMGESLAPVTEGEPMRHMPHHMSQNIESTSSSSVSSGSLRSGGRSSGLGLGPGGQISKRISQDDTTASCSSSTSLDGPRSPTRRRSSTVSQCSSILSEGTRQQLNFDLSPDLPPDSSILEANAISPTDFDRPASPEPSSLDSSDGCFDMRPLSRLSYFNPSPVDCE